MTRSAASHIIFFYLALTLFISAFAQTSDFVYQTNDYYEYGDWIGYSCHRFVNAVAFGEDEVYFATTGGIAAQDMQYPAC